MARAVDQDLLRAYAEDFQQRQEAEQEQAMQEAVQRVRTRAASGDTGEVLGPPSPPPRPGALSAGAEAAWEQGKAGMTHFTRGVFDLIQRGWKIQGNELFPSSWLSPAGESLLGVLGIVGALPVGVGTAVQAAMQQYTPALEQQTALKGGEFQPDMVPFMGGSGAVTKDSYALDFVRKNPATALRFALGVPALLLDPQLRQSLTPETLSKMFAGDMTYGELANVMAQLAAFKGMESSYARVRGGPPGAPGAPGLVTPEEVATEYVNRLRGLPAGGPGPLALPERASPAPGPARGPGGGIPQPPSTLAAPAPTAEVLRETRPYQEPPPILQGAPPTAPGPPDVIIDVQGRPVSIPAAEMAAGIERERLRAFERTPLEAPPRGPEPAPPPTTEPTGALPTAAGVSAERAAALPMEPRPVIKRPYEAGAPVEVPGPPEAAPGALLTPQGVPVDAIPEPPAAGIERARLRAFERTPLEALPRQPEAAPPTPAVPTGPLQSAYERAVAKIEGVLGEERPQAVRGVPAEATAAEPPPALPVAGGGPTAEELALLPKATEPGAVPPPLTDAGYNMLWQMYDDLKNAEPGSRHLIADEMGKVVGGLAQPSSYPAYMGELGVPRTRAGADRAMKIIEAIADGKDVTTRDADIAGRLVDYSNRVGPTLFGETGRVNQALLARMAVGAAIGCGTADNAEECLKRALVGMLGGALLPVGVLKSLLNQASRLKAEGKPVPPDLRAGIDRAATDMARKMATAIREELPALGQVPKRPVPDPREPYQPNYNRIAAEETVKQVMREVYAGMQAEVIEQRRGVQPLEATEQKARALIQSGTVRIEDILGAKPGDVWNAEQVTAARILEVGVANYIYDLARAMHAGAPIPQGKLRAGLGLLAEMVPRRLALTSEAARATGAHRITVEGALDPKRVADLADQLAGDMPDADLAALTLGNAAMRNPETLGRFARFLRAFPGAVLESFMGAILGGTTTFKTLTSNLLMVPLTAAERSIAGVFGRGHLPGASVSDGYMYLTGAWEAVLEQLRMVKHWEELRSYWADRSSLYGLEGYGDRPPQPPRITAEALGLDELGALSTAVDFYGKIVRTSLESVSMADTPFRVMNGRGQLKIEAQRIAARDGFVDADLARTAAFYEQNPELLPQVARDRVTKAARDGTFSRDLEGVLGSALQRGPEDPWLNLMYRNLIVAFVRSPVRIMETTLLGSPLAPFVPSFWRDVRPRGNFALGTFEAQNANAALVAGSVLLGAFTYLASTGFVTGSPPADPTYRKLWLQNHQPYSVRLGDTWVSHDGLGPMSNYLTTGADLAQMLQYAPEISWPQLIGSALVMQGDNLNMRQYFMNFSHLIDAISNPRAAGGGEKLFQYLRSQLTSYAPAAFREIRLFTDPARREAQRAPLSGAYPEGSWWQQIMSVWDAYKAATPGLSDAKDAEGNFLYPPDRDFFTGQPQFVTGIPFVTRTKPAPPPDPVWAEVERLHGAGLTQLPDAIGAGATQEQMPLVPQVDYARPSTFVRLTPPEKDRWAVLMTQGVRDPEGRTFHGAMQALIGSALYRQQADPMKASLLQQQATLFRKMGEEALRKEYPLLDSAIRRKRMEAIAQSVPPNQQSTVRGVFERVLQSIGR